MSPGVGFLWMSDIHLECLMNFPWVDTELKIDTTQHTNGEVGISICDIISLLAVNSNSYHLPRRMSKTGSRKENVESSSLKSLLNCQLRMWPENLDNQKEMVKFRIINLRDPQI